jgi:hypothetical protein
LELEDALDAGAAGRPAGAAAGLEEADVLAPAVAAGAAVLAAEAALLLADDSDSGGGPDGGASG